MTAIEPFAARRRAFHVIAVAGIVTAALAACGGRNGSGNARDSASGASATAGMPGMQGMGGPMMEQMQAHMRMMETANADSMKAMLPMHRQMVGNMLSEMNRQMGQMKMTADARWTALSDSVRQDLVRLPNLSASELSTFMPDHRGRVTRLMEMQRSMMGGMRM